MENSEALVPTADEKQWAMLCHLSCFSGWIIPFGNLVAPIVIWQMKKDTMPFVDQHGKEAVNFQITMFIATIVAALSTLVIIGIVLLPALLIFQLVVIIKAALKSNEGEPYRYPLTIRFIN